MTILPRPAGATGSVNSLYDNWIGQPAWYQDSTLSAPNFQHSEAAITNYYGWKMYHRLDGGIGLISSVDGNNWNGPTQQVLSPSSLPNTGFIFAPKVLVGPTGILTMVFEAAQTNTAPGCTSTSQHLNYIGIATSTDGVNWSNPRKIIAAQQPWEGRRADGVHCGNVGTPSITLGHDGQYYVTYHGYNGQSPYKFRRGVASFSDPTTVTEATITRYPTPMAFQLENGTGDAYAYPDYDVGIGAADVIRWQAGSGGVNEPTAYYMVFEGFSKFPLCGGLYGPLPEIHIAIARADSPLGPWRVQDQVFLGKKLDCGRDLPSWQYQDGHYKVVLAGENAYGLQRKTLFNNFKYGPRTMWHDWFGWDGHDLASGDINGDGKADLVAFTKADTGDVWVSYSNGGGFGEAVFANDWFAPGSEKTGIGDFNSDGTEDIVTFTGGDWGDVYVALSNGFTFGGGQKWHDWFAPWAEKPAVGDFNGDGKDDIATIPGNGLVYVALSNGSGFGPAPVWHNSFSYDAGGDRILAGDVNGDGRDDLVGINSGGGVWVILSNGNGFSSAQQWHGYFAPGSEVPRVGDVNADGKDDIVTFVGNGYVWVAFSNGGSFGGGELWHTGFAANGTTTSLNDTTGDGRADAIEFDRAPTGDVWVARAGQ